MFKFGDSNAAPALPHAPAPFSKWNNTSAVSAVAGAAAEKTRRPVAKKPEFEGAAPTDTPDVEADDTLADIETDDEAISDDDDETFLESEEEDGGDVSGIIGGPVPEGDEEP